MLEERNGQPTWGHWVVMGSREAQQSQGHEGQRLQVPRCGGSWHQCCTASTEDCTWQIATDSDWTLAQEGIKAGRRCEFQVLKTEDWKRRIREENGMIQTALPLPERSVTVHWVYLCSLCSSTSQWLSCQRPGILPWLNIKHAPILWGSDRADIFN